MKDKSTVIEEFNDIVNMTASELETWLKSDDSRSAGWPKGDEDGESVGHDSGRNIVSILESNPDKDAEKYTDEQIQHMRKVVSYWRVDEVPVHCEMCAKLGNSKRHLAQEEGANSEKSTAEVKKTKSYASLKNWGHDVLKKRGSNGAANGDSEHQTGDKRKAEEEAAGASKKRETKQGSSAQDDKGNEKASNGKKEENENASNGKKENGHSDGATKKRSTPGRKTRNSGGEKGKKDDAEENDSEVEDEGDGEDEEEDEDEENGQEKKASNGNGKAAKPAKGPEKGETVSWNWGNGQPEGKVLDVKGEKTTVETKRGNEVSRHGDPEDPAVVIDTGKSKAIKSAHELN